MSRFFGDEEQRKDEDLEGCGDPESVRLFAYRRAARQVAGEPHCRNPDLVGCLAPSVLVLSNVVMLEGAWRCLVLCPSARLLRFFSVARDTKLPLGGLRDRAYPLASRRQVRADLWTPSGR